MRRLSLLLFAGKDLALLEVGGKGAVACLVLLFDLAHHREESGQLGEALLLGLSCHAGALPLSDFIRAVGRAPTKLVSTPNSPTT